MNEEQTVEERDEMLLSRKTRGVTKTGNRVSRVSISNRGRRLTGFHSTVSTHTEYRGYRYYRNRGSNDHTINTGIDQSINYFGKTCIKILNNCFKRSEFFAFYTAHATLILQKLDKKYYINGNMLTKTKLNAVIPSILMRFPMTTNENSFNTFVDNIINTDPVITAAIVNKIEYTFYTEGKSGPFSKKITTLLNVEKTGKEHSAIELYEGLWVDFKDTQMKSFINSCRGNKNKFLGISPEELYYLSRKEVLSPLAIKTVYAFLEQNRKSSLVEKRSMELFRNLTERFKGRIFEKEMLVEERVSQCMAVKGKQLDWIVVDRGYKQGRQDVSTYMVMCTSNFTWNSENERYNAIPELTSGLSDYRMNHVWRNESNDYDYILVGPICIDQAHAGISIGDQFAARSMALLNDVHSFAHVSTLRNFTHLKVENRVDWDAVSKMFKKE